AGRLHRPDPPPAAPTRQPASTPPRGATLPPQAASSGFVPAEDAAQHMSPKAVIYYRKAETCVKRGDLRGAILQLKLAISTDPLSVFLRTALAEVEAEARRAT